MKKISMAEDYIMNSITRYMLKSLNDENEWVNKKETGNEGNSDFADIFTPWEVHILRDSFFGNDCTSLGEIFCKIYWISSTGFWN